MDDSQAADQRQFVAGLDAAAARELGRGFDSEGDLLKRQARALFAYADTLDGEHARPAVSETEDETAGSRSAPAAPPSNKRPLILVLIRERPSPAWTPNEIRRSLIERRMIPAETSSASIRVTLRRMVEKGELMKTPSGQYTIPRDNQEGTLV